MTAPGTSTPDLFAQIRALNEQFLAAWSQATDAFLASAAGQELTRETGENYIAARAALARAAREAWGPLIEAAGAVPLAEFQRLADQVQLILQRLDRIDDALAALLEAHQCPAPAPAPRKSRKKSG